MLPSSPGNTNPIGKVSSTAGETAAPRRTLVEDELVDSVAWLIRLRWIAGLGVILATWLVPLVFNLQVPRQPLTIIGISILLYNLIFFLTEHRIKQIQAPIRAYRRLAFGQVGLDWLAMILLIHFSGGIESPAILFFIFHIINASILFPPITAYTFTILAIILLTMTVVMELFSILPHHAIGGFLVVPLYQNNLYVIAILVFFSSTSLIAAYLATSIQKRLRQREEDVFNLTESLQRVTIRLQALNDSARAINSTLELKQVLERLVKTTSDVMEVRACSIRLLSKSGERLEPVAVYGLSQAYLDKGPIELPNNPLARAVLAGQIVNVPDVTQTSLLQYPAWAVQEGIYAMLSAPLVGKNGPLGILRAYARERDHFTPDDEIFLTAIAAQGSIAIENALAYQSIEELDDLKSNFIRTFTHELRSPVSVTRSLLRTITAGYTGQVNEQQKDILERATRRVDFLQKLIDDLLDLAAGKANLGPTVVTEPARLEEVLPRLVSRYEPPAKEKNLILAWRVEGEASCAVMASPEALDRIFNNLLSNAVKYTPRDGKVTVTLSRRGDEAVTVVEDTGIGIPKESMEHLFEEFYRAPNAKEFEREGTGLGLTIVKDLITHLGGQISVQSTAGTGTRFTVHLPLAVEKSHSTSL